MSTSKYILHFYGEKEMGMERSIVQQPHIEHVRKITFSLYTVCNIDIERKVEEPDLELITACRGYNSDKVSSGKTSYTIDLKV
jgi:hypothetical protein